MSILMSSLELLKAIGLLFLKIWWSWAWIIPIIIIKKVVSSARFKGSIGEKDVSRQLNKLPKEKYFVLNDILLKSNEGTSQIDHIVVSVYGVFIIETKNYQGSIYGAEKSYNWTQNIYGNKQSFKNPIHQNYGHIKAIEECLSSYGSIPVKPIVVFSNVAELHIDTFDTPVINTSELVNCVNALSTTEVITEELVKELVETISEKNITVKEERKKHNEEAKYKKYVKEEKSLQGLCPRCNGNLVIRYGKNGQFKGCSNYPKCRYTENV